MLTKEKIIQTVEEFDDPVSIDELIERIILLGKIEQGLSDSDQNNVISENELDNEINKWSK
jgi:hypothetical protein